MPGRVGQARHRVAGQADSGPVAVSGLGAQRIVLNNWVYFFKLIFMEQ